MSESVIGALIGIVGTVIGTILGWLLNNLSNKGKLNLYVSEWNYKFQKQDEIGGFVDASDFTESKYFHYDLSVDVYNSSGETKIMRNVKILFQKKKELIWKHSPNDDSTRRISGPMSFYDNVQPINVEPKTVFKIKMHFGLWESDEKFSELMDVDRIYLSYVNEYNKEKKVLVAKIFFEDFFITRDKT